MEQTKEATPSVIVAQISTKVSGSKKAHLIAFEMTLRGSTTPLRVLLDPGATDNFVSEDALKRFNIFNHSTVIPSHDIIVRLATGIRVRTVIGLNTTT